MAGGPKTSNGGGAAKPKRVVLTKNQKKRLKKKQARAARHPHNEPIDIRIISVAVSLRLKTTEPSARFSLRLMMVCFPIDGTPSFDNRNK